MISGSAKRFSWLYRPGATKAHIWYMIQGSTAKMPTIISTLSGTKKGVNTPTAMSLASGGMWALIGWAMKSISPLGPGHTASTAIARPMP